MRKLRILTTFAGLRSLRLIALLRLYRVVTFLLLDRIIHPAFGAIKYRFFFPLEIRILDSDTSNRDSESLELSGVIDSSSTIRNRTVVPSSVLVNQ